jgi:stage V sporulation protein S
MDILKVSTKSSPNAVAGAIAGILREQSVVCVQVIGAGALNQAIKAIAIARSFVSDDGIDPICIPTFHDVDIGGESRTAIRLQVEHRTERPSGVMQNPPESSGEASAAAQST